MPFEVLPDLLPFHLLGGMPGLIILSLLWVVFWVHQFLILMRLDTDAFPSEIARGGWIAFFFIIFWLAPIAFVFYHASLRKEHHEPRGSEAVERSRRRRRRHRREADI